MSLRLRPSICAILVFCVGIANSSDLAALEWPDESDRVEEALSSTDPAVRKAATARLGSLSSRRIESLLPKLLTDSAVDVRLAAAEIFVAGSYKTVVFDAKAWLSEGDARLRIAACDLLRKSPKSEHVALLTRLLSDADDKVRRHAARALARSESPDAVPALLGRLDDPNPEVRIDLIQALGEIGDPRALIPLMGKGSDASPEVRRALARTLRKIRDPRALQPLLGLLRDVSPEVRMEAIESAQSFPSVEVVATLAPFLRDRDARLRLQSAETLGVIPLPEAAAALVTALGSFEDETAPFGPTPLRKAIVAHGRRALASVVSVLARADAPFVSASWILSTLKIPEADAPLLMAARQGRAKASVILPALCADSSVPVVLGYLRSSDPATRQQARTALKRFLVSEKPDGRAVEPLADAYRTAKDEKERNELLRLLGRTGSIRAIPILLGALNDSKFRWASAEGLGWIRSPKAERELVPLLSHAEANMRTIAAQGLGRIGEKFSADAIVVLLLESPDIEQDLLLAALSNVAARSPISAPDLERIYEHSSGRGRDTVVQIAGRSGVFPPFRLEPRRMRILATSMRSPWSAIDSAKRNALDDVAKAEVAWRLGIEGTAVDISKLSGWASAQELSVAVNATAALGRMAGRIKDAASLRSVLCKQLHSPHPWIRANAVRGLSFDGRQCEITAATLLAQDPSAAVRIRAAEWAVRTGNDRARLRCIEEEKDIEVAAFCKGKTFQPSIPSKIGRGETLTDTAGAPRVDAPYVLAYADGFIRVGTTDLSGVAFDAVPLEEEPAFLTEEKTR